MSGRNVKYIYVSISSIVHMYVLNEIYRHDAFYKLA